MKITRRRLNEIRILDSQSVQKVGTEQEISRSSRLEVEAWALSFAQKRGVRVPRLLSYSRNPLGQEVLITERVWGGTLSLRELFQNPSILEQVGEQMTLLGNAASRYGWIDPVARNGSHESWQEFLSLYVQQHGRSLVQLAFIDVGSLMKVGKAIEATDFDLPLPYLLHRDLQPSNFLRDSRGNIWILDWEHAILGDPLYDIAIVGIRYGHGLLWKHLLNGYDLGLSPQRYLLYEIIALMGTVDFYRKAGFSYRTKLNKLSRLIRKL